MAQPSDPRGTIFISYSSRDRDWLARLRPYLMDLQPQIPLDIWSDQDIPLGEEWRPTLEAALDAAVAAVLLVSPHYLVSSFITEIELPPLLEAAAARGCRILPVLVSEVGIPESISRYMFANPLRKPLDQMGGLWQNTFLKLTDAILHVASEVNAQKQNVYIAIPMSSVRKKKYKAMRKLAADVAAAFEQCGAKVYCAALDLKNPEWDPSRVALQALKNIDTSRVFVMVYPAELPSSVLVEAGYALKRRMRSIYFVHRKARLPYLLANADNQIVDIWTYKDPTQICQTIVNKYRDLLA